MPEVKCNQCGETLQRSKSRAKGNNFCDRQCLSNWHRSNRADVDCENCGEQLSVQQSKAELYDKHFCSNDCQGEWYSANKSGENNPRTGKERPEHSKRMTGDNNPAKREDIKEKLAKIKSRLTGEDAPNWQGGKSFEEYPKEFNTRLKEDIRNRDDRECKLCGIKESQLEKRLAVHHIDGDKTNCSKDNLIALCISCNRKVEGMDERPTFSDYIRNIYKN